MEIEIIPKNLEVTEEEKNDIKEKVSSLEKFLKGISEYKVRVIIEKILPKEEDLGIVYIVEEILETPFERFVAKAKSFKLELAVAEAKNELKIQLEKFKEKIRAKERKGEIDLKNKIRGLDKES